MTSTRTPAVPHDALATLVTGVVALVAGGIVAALTGPAQWERGSWVAAYLVLVVGVGQIGLGLTMVALSRRPVPRGRILAFMALYDGGSALVIVGTLATSPVAVTVGGVLFAASLVVVLRSPVDNEMAPVWTRWTWRALVLVLLVSTPIGLALSWLGD